MFKIISFLVAGLLLMSCQCGQQAGAARKKVNPIVVSTPQRPAGQTDVVGLTTPKLDTVRVGFIGLGMRGPGAVSRFTHIPGTKVVALCDIRPERVESCPEYSEKSRSSGSSSLFR